MDLFGLDYVLKEETLYSVDKNRFYTVSIKETTGAVPYQVSVENGSCGHKHGKKSYSFYQLEEAEKKFSSVISAYSKEGFQQQFA